MSSDRMGESSATVSTGLRLRLLGTPECEVGGAGERLRDQKAWALLFYLAVTGGTHSRDYLATLLWGDSPESNARHSLRSSLYHLRQTLADSESAQTLTADTAQVHLRIRADQCDVLRFRELLKEKTESALAEAVSLYRGPLLEGFTVTDAPVFEQWLRFEASGLSHAYENALDRLVALAEAAQAWDRAIEYAEQMIQVDALDEKAEMRLLQLYLRSGATGRALRHYQQFKETLRRELGLAPRAEIEELLTTALRPQQPSADQLSEVPGRRRTVPPLPMHSTIQTLTPVVGRNGLLTQLRALGDVAKTRHGVTVLLHGEAGMGKTRILEELLAGLAETQPQWVILRGSCSPFDDLLSYGPFYDAFQSATSGDLRDLLGTEPGNSHTQAGSIMWRVLETLRMLTQGGPLLLAIDDLHWANSATLRLFGFLSTRIQALPLMLVGTVQHPESIPAIGRLVAVGRHRGKVHLISVGPLDLPAVAALLSAQDFDPDSVASLAAWLHDRSGGSPFILGEILAHFRANGVIANDDSGWHLDAARWLRERVRFSLPETTHDLLAWRLAPLSPGALHLLDVLAVSGQPLPLSLLPDLASDPASLQTLEDLITRGLIVEVSGDGVGLSHCLLREALLSRMSHRRHRSLHLLLLEALERYHASDSRVTLRQLALHSVEGEDADRARRYGLAVLDELWQDEPCAETLRFLHQLQDLLLPSAGPTELIRLAHALGHLHQSLGQIEAAARWQHQYLELAQLASDVSAQVTAYLEIAELALVTNDYAAAAEAAAAALELCRTLDDVGSAVLSGRGYRLLGAARAMEGSDLAGAVGYLQEAVSAHTRAESQADLAADWFELGNVAAQRGDLLGALDLYEEAKDAASRGHSYYFLALAHNNFAYHSLLLGRVDVAEQAAMQGQRVAETHELIGALLHLYSTHGEIHLYRAEWERARQYFRQGLALAAELGNLERQAGYRASLAQVARGQGDFEQAVSLLEEARALIAGQGYWHMHVRILLWLAETWWLQRNFDRAWVPLEEALAISGSQGRVFLAVQGQRLRAQLLAGRGQKS